MTKDNDQKLEKDGGREKDQQYCQGPQKKICIIISKEITLLIWYC